MVNRLNLSCRKCGGEKRKTKKGRPYCPTCQKEYARINKDKISKYRKKWGVENREYLINYREANKDYIKEKRKEWGTNNKEHTTEYFRKYNREVRHPDYPIWVGMKSRCYNPNNEKYPRYGGRGIFVCDRWKNSFENFIEDMGPRPAPRYRYSIERIDTDGNYEPNNCCWATAKQQARNTSRTRLVEVDGEEMSLAEAAERLGIPYATAQYRFKKIIDKDYQIDFQGHKITLEELSIKTNINLKIVIRRATRLCNAEYITSPFRSVPTYLYKGIPYTVDELAVLCELNSRELFARIRKRKKDIDKIINDGDV